MISEMHKQESVCYERHKRHTNFKLSVSTFSSAFSAAKVDMQVLKHSRLLSPSSGSNESKMVSDYQ
jgi:hypothetical protein